MALGAALVDRARIVREAAVGTKVEGTTIFDPTWGSWFRCRLTINTEQEGTAGPDARRVTRQASLMYALHDSIGDHVELHGSDRVEVDSKALGRALYEVSGDSTPIRKKRTLIGREVNITLVSEHAYPGLS